uniref:Glycosyl transferase CAP10 domain-containing protein n=1 Tax=Kalanchoe fedtschenkoi TaxID=63787 RepID=A0A7N0TH08_KALFE
MPVAFRSSKSSHFPRFILKSFIFIALFSLIVLVLYKVAEHVESIASQIKTVAGHNLKPTPWHRFPQKTFDDESRFGQASKIIRCSYLMKCSSSRRPVPKKWHLREGQGQCPDFFRWIHHDLEPWSMTKISTTHLMKAKKFAAFRVVIVDGRLYTEFYHDCFQTRAMFTIWGLLQLLKRYPGHIPDVDLMFDCMDKPFIERDKHRAMPLPLFRYCTTPQHFDIPFPDWSFWGWPETNIQHWDKQFKDIKQGSQAVTWIDRLAFAYWKGNPDTGSPARSELLHCNDTLKWGAQILRQNWAAEAEAGFKDSNLSNQCKHRYKIYAEGYAWSVSLKYILSCGSTTLMIAPKYEDFFTRGLMPKDSYWPIPPTEFCPAIKFAVDWGNGNTAAAEAIGQRAQQLMETLTMDRVYDYMFHLLSEYSSLQDFKPAPPPSAFEVCESSLLCFANQIQTKFLKNSAASPSPNPPFKIPPHDPALIDSWIKQKTENINEVENMRQVNPGQPQH